MLYLLIHWVKTEILRERLTCVKTYRLKETITLILGEPVNTYKEGLAEDVSTEKLNVITLTG